VRDVIVSAWYSGRYYCQSVDEWAILLLECRRAGDITIRVWQSGRNNCQSVVEWAILLSDCGRWAILLSVW